VLLSCQLLLENCLHSTIRAAFPLIYATLSVLLCNSNDVLIHLYLVILSYVLLHLSRSRLGGLTNPWKSVWRLRSADSNGRRKKESRGDRGRKGEVRTKLSNMGCLFADLETFFESMCCNNSTILYRRPLFLRRECTVSFVPFLRSWLVRQLFRLCVTFSQYSFWEHLSSQAAAHTASLAACSMLVRASIRGMGPRRSACGSHSRNGVRQFIIPISLLHSLCLESYAFEIPQHNIS
jgi:hypothetical protein